MPEFLSNSHLNRINQNIKTPYFDDNIIVVGCSPYSRDSLIGAVVEKIAAQGPRVIVVDFALNDSSLVGHFSIPDSVNIVLGTPIDEHDSIYYSLNIFNKKVEHAHVMSSGMEYMSTSDKPITPLPVAVVKLFDNLRYREFLKRGNDEELVNYVNSHNLPYYDDYSVLEDTFVPEFFRGKIVLVGGTGESEKPLIPGALDNIDVHMTPTGEQFGVIVLYNEIHTVLGDFTNKSKAIYNYAMATGICMLTMFLIFGLSHLNKRVLYIISKLYVAALIFGFLTAGVYAFYAHDILIDYQALCLSAIVSAEVSFWMTIR